MRQQWFTHVRLLVAHLTRSCRAFSATLTTPALDRRSLRWFGLSACTASPEGLPPSLAQHGLCWRLLHRHHVSFQDTRTRNTSSSSSCGPRTPLTARSARCPGQPTTSRSAPQRTPRSAATPVSPDDYLEHLDGLVIETTITATELCTVGMWSGLTAATVCWTGRRSKYVLTTYARSGKRTRRPLPKAADVTWTLCMTRCIRRPCRTTVPPGDHLL